MKKRWIAIALLTVLLMGIGGAIGKVGVRQESDGSAYALYFVERDLRSADGGDALRSEERTLEDSGLSAEELAAALVAELLKGPADPTLKARSQRERPCFLQSRRERSCGWISPRLTAPFPAWGCLWRTMPLP